MARPRWLRSSELRNYIVLSAWLLRVYDLWHEGWSPLMKKILHLWKVSGKTFLVQYLKECTRLVQKWVASENPGVSTPSVRCDNSGLPLIIPKCLRLLIRDFKYRGVERGRLVLKGVLTILTVYRVIGIKPIRKLQTITSAFSGTSTLLMDGEVNTVLSWLGKKLILPKCKILWINESAGPNFPRSTWGSPLDAIAFVTEPMVWLSFAYICIRSGTTHLLVWQVTIVLLALPVLPILCIRGFRPKLGKLSELFEGAGKVRVVAVVDWWTQTVLKPLHDAIFSILKTIPQDGTFNQHKPTDQLLDRIRLGTGVWSFDLSAATDRLPLDFQIQVLRLIGLPWAKAWGRLLSGRKWFLGKVGIKYAVGQPMGAYSSWAMLALSHHVIVQVAALRSGWSSWFPHYAVLGDDIVIADEMVAFHYQAIMHGLGVDISPSKGLVSRSVFEFAKRTVHVFRGDVSPLGAGAVLVAIRNVRYLPILILDILRKGVTLSPDALISATNVIGLLRRHKSYKNLKQLIALVAMGPTGGQWLGGPVTAQNWAGYWIQLLIPGKSLAVGLSIVARYYRQLMMDKYTTDSIRLVREYEHLEKSWWRVSLTGPSLLDGILSIPLVLLGPGVWSYVVTLRARFEDSADARLASDQIQAHTQGWTATNLTSNLELFQLFNEDGLVDVSTIRFAEREEVLRMLSDMERLISYINKLNSTPARPPRRARRYNALVTLSEAPEVG